jgi:formyltetrahydrofolate-dependent phosphoribosylglycinamide formyltransferase
MDNRGPLPPPPAKPPSVRRGAARWFVAGDLAPHRQALFAPGNHSGKRVTRASQVHPPGVKNCRFRAAGSSAAEMPLMPAPSTTQPSSSQNSGANQAERADAAGLPAVHVGKRADESRADYDARLADVVSGFDPDWIVLAGWLRVLSSAFLDRFPNRVINLHPALPGAFPGMHAIARAYAAYQRGEIDHTGVMIHLVPDEGVDVGPVLAQEIVPILADDTLATLETRMHQTEHHLLIETLKTHCIPRQT